MTFPTGVVEIRKCSDEELKTMLDDAREASKYSRKLGRVMGIVAARRLQQMKDLLTFEKLATWRRMNGFDRVADGEDNWFHGPRSLPPTPEEFTESLWCKVNELKSAISMPATTRLWRKTMNFVDGLKGKLPGEKLAVRVFQQLGGGGGYDDFVPGNVTKTTPSRDRKLHDPLHSRQACPKFNSFRQGVGQISPLEGLFSCRTLSKRG